MIAGPDDRLYDPEPDHLRFLNLDHLLTETRWAEAHEAHARTLRDANPGCPAVRQYWESAERVADVFRSELRRREKG